MTILDTLQSFFGNAWIYGGTFILVLSLLVFVHEWGHYIVARLCGVRVEIFSIGFGKELFGRDDKHGTRWKFSLIPLGGYVKMFGDTDPASAGYDDAIEDGKTGKTRKMSKKEREEAFFSKSVGKRALIVFAGPAINYIFAIILFAGLFTFNGKPITPPVAGAVIEGSSADKAGIKPLDKVISIDGNPTKSFESLRREMTIALDQERHFVVERDGERLDIYATPEKETITDRFGFSHSRGLLGLINTRLGADIEKIQSIAGQDYSEVSLERKIAAIKKRLGTTFKVSMRYGGDDVQTLIISPLQRDNVDLGVSGRPYEKLLLVANVSENDVIKYGPLQAFGKAIEESWSITAGTLKSMGQMITGARPASELGGLIRIGAIAGDMMQQGLISIILFTALLSINLGLINLFPVPLLDGGHLVFYAIEALRGKPVPEKIQGYAFQFGLILLIALMAFANINDVVQMILN